MDYTAEVSGPTTQINNIVSATSTETDPVEAQSNLTPFDSQRDQIVGHLGNDFDNMTTQAVQTRTQVEEINDVRRRVKAIQGQKTSIQAGIASSTSQLSTAQKDLNIQLAKQKIAFELLSVFAVTIIIYIVLGSFSYVHMIALGFMVLGLLYVMNFNAYRLGAIGEDIGSATLTTLGKTLTSFTPSYLSLPDPTSFFSPPNADGPNSMPTASSLYSDSVV